MKKYDSLLCRISDEMNILQGASESQDSWKARVIYSALGHMAIASLHDIQEDGSPVSITHFKRRVDKTL